MKIRQEVCRLCRFWSNHKGALASIFYGVWSAQVDARKDPSRDKLDYGDLYVKYPYGMCDCDEFVDMSPNSYQVGAKDDDPDFRKCPQKGLLYRDGEGCGASFVTRENFGCVYWILRGNNND